jgi:hypothetical protein
LAEDRDGEDDREGVEVGVVTAGALVNEPKGTET